MAATTHETFQIYHDDFRAIIGNDPTIELLHQVDSYPFAHEAGVWVNETNELFVTSAQFKDGVHAQKRVQLSKIVVPGDHGSSHPVRHEEIESGEVPMGNGGVNYGDKHIIFCSQGSPTRPSGLIMMDNHPPYKTEPLITTFLGRPFNSVNDVVVHSDGSIWFTDPCYGFDQCFRPRPSLPNCVYRYEPSTQAIRAVADGFGRPNGICFSPDEKTVYITDTDQFHGDSKDHSRAASM